MRNYKSVLLFTCCFALSVASVCAQRRNFKPNLLIGPTTAPLGGVAQIEVPAGYEFIDGPSLRELMKAAGEPVSDDLLGSISPTNADWSVLFTYLDIGYVKDDDKDKLNADKLLEEYRQGTEEQNKIRQKSGIPPIHVVGWELPPRYNDVTHNLEWAIRGASEGDEILNYDTRLLGRKGVMQIKLIVDPKEFASVLRTYTNLMAGYTFQTGQSYAEYRKGDKVAKYGLAALITGAAALGAAKLGLFAWLAVLFKKGAKLIIVAVVAVIAFFRKIFARLFGRSDPSRS